MRFRLKFLFLIACLLILPFVYLNGANLTIPLFELVSRGYMEDGIAFLNTRGTVDFHIEGGYKFGGSITLGLNSDNLNGTANTLSENSSTSDISNYLNSVPFLQFKAAEVTIREIFNSPLNFSYFTGLNSVFANGDDFRTVFGTGSIGSRVRGYVYFPEGVIYDGIYQVNGTGIKLDTNFGSDSVLTEIYTYQDAYLGQGYFSSHLRSLFSLQNLKIETYTGVSYPVHPYGMYSAGMLIYYAPAERASFLTQVGVPRYIPDVDTISIEHFFFLFEPRVHFSNASLIFTLFWHPDYYKEYLFSPNGESGSVDMNMNLQIGKPEESITSGGIETNASYETAGDRELNVRVSPYLSLITEGVIWDMKVNAHVLPYDFESLIELFIGVRAEF